MSKAPYFKRFMNVASVLSVIWMAVAMYGFTDSRGFSDFVISAWLLVFTCGGLFIFAMHFEHFIKKIAPFSIPWLVVLIAYLIFEHHSFNFDRYAFILVVPFICFFIVAVINYISFGKPALWHSDCQQGQG
jgi:hypothetical protein